MKKIILILLTVAYGMYHVAFANQPIHTYILIPSATNPKNLVRKYITLNSVSLNQNNQKNIQPSSYSQAKAPLLPQKAWASMNVPTLDQGIHGTCVTFAVTSALDAVLKRKEYISQLCNLALGLDLDPKKSGWNGSSSEKVLQQIATYGAVTIDYQKKHSCGGLYEYPTHMNYTSSAMSATEFAKHSVFVMKEIEAEMILTFAEVYHGTANPDEFFNKTKTAIAAGKLVILEAIVVVPDLASGKYKALYNYDSFILTPDIRAHLKNHTGIAGHAMVIIGYDDDAVIKGPNKSKHKGAFVLRNSWGELAGFHGHYYMSYDYFKALTITLIAVKKK